jgi:RNA polymerase sigma factor (sigma-70 family)
MATIGRVRRGGAAMGADAQRARETVPGAAEDHLSRIETVWQEVSLALRHSGDPESQEALRAFFLRYKRAIERYLIVLLSDDAQDAEDLAHSFVTRVLEGRYKAIKPQPGRFRYYVKEVLRNLVSDYRRDRYRNRRKPLGEIDVEAPATATGFDQEFVEIWRQQLLQMAMNQLATMQVTAGRPFFNALEIQGSAEGVSSEELAARLSERLRRPVTTGSALVTLHRARKAYGLLLLKEVAASLGEPTREQLEEELIAVGLHEYCRRYIDTFEAHHMRAVASPARNEMGDAHHQDLADGKQD